MKKTTGIALATMALLLAYAAPGHAHFRGGVWIGPVWGPWWGPAYPYPYVYPQQPVVIEQQPTQYIQQPEAPPQQQYWYYCPDPQGYYPYVKTCPKGWKQVVPTPAPPETEE